MVNICILHHLRDIYIYGIMEANKITTLLVYSNSVIV